MGDSADATPATDASFSRQRPAFEAGRAGNDLLTWSRAKFGDSSGSHINTGYDGQGSQRVSDQAFQSQLTMLLVFLFEMLSRSRIQCSRDTLPSVRGAIESSQSSNNCKALALCESEHRQSSNQVVALKPSSDQQVTPFLGQTETRVPGSSFAMSGNNQPPSAIAQQWLEAATQHKDFKPGQVYTNLSIEKGAANVGNVIGNNSNDSNYRNNLYDGAKVSNNSSAIFGDIPESLARDIHLARQPQQQQQQQYVAPQDHRQKIVSKPDASNAEAPSYLFSGPGRRVGS